MNGGRSIHEMIDREIVYLRRQYKRRLLIIELRSYREGSLPEVAASSRVGKSERFIYGVVNQKGLCFAKKGNQTWARIATFSENGHTLAKGKRQDDSLRSAILDDRFMEDGHFYFCKQFTEQSAQSKRLRVNGIDVIAFVLSKTFGSRSYCQNKWSERQIPYE